MNMFNHTTFIYMVILPTAAASGTCDDKEDDLGAGETMENMQKIFALEKPFLFFCICKLILQ